MKPRITVNNDSSTPLSNFQVHYFFTVDAGKTPVLGDLYTPLSTPSLNQVGGNLWRVVYNYSDYTLAPGGSTDPNEPPDGNVVHLRYTDWSAWNRTDDWSYAGVSGTLSQTDKIVVVDSTGAVVHGFGPDGVFPDPTPEVEERHWFAATIPSDQAFSGVALGASWELLVGDGADVAGVTANSWAVVANSGAGLTELGIGAESGSAYGGAYTRVR